MVAVAHGSRDPRAAATVTALLEAVRARRPDVPVHASFLDHAPPAPEAVLDGLARGGADEVVVLPLLLTAAYHSKTDVPGALRRAGERHPRLGLRTAGTLGPHPLLVAALERRLAEAGVPPGDPDTAVVLVSAGSSDASANATIGRLAREWRSRGWWDVVPAYAATARPAPAEAVAALHDAGAPRVVVASYFLAPGRLADRVRSQSLAAGATAVSAELGAAPEVAELVVLRYDAVFTAIPAHGLAWRLARDRSRASANRFAIFPAGLASGFAPPVRARARVTAEEDSPGGS
ncbi:sirohydrochlorin chelatase [Actinomadura roseirufa]|uniref:sirohydrochlorin chelatase n=1 Tax=Actinomadura roseirufa TaxID=2094049 RepID=UPI001041100C|nr:sirohydrochlorin chelatase [Actinomadura roseirufa]